MNISESIPGKPLSVLAHRKPNVRLSIRREGLAVAAVVAASLIWGSSFLFGKIALQQLAVSQVVLIRFLIASLSLLPVALLRSREIQQRDWPLFLLVGFLAVPVTFLVQFHGLALTTINRASLIIGTAPPLMALGGYLFLHERLNRRSWVAVIGSVVGIALISGSPGEGGGVLGEGLVLLSIVISVVWVLISKRMSRRYGALLTTSVIIVSGTLTLIPITYGMDGFPPLQVSATVWGALIALGLFCTTLTFLLWNWGLEWLPASKAGVYLNLEPLVGVVLGVVFWGERLYLGIIIGGLLVLSAGIEMARIEPSRARTPRNVNA